MNAPRRPAVESAALARTVTRLRRVVSRERGKARGNSALDWRARLASSLDELARDLEDDGATR